MKKVLLGATILCLVGIIVLLTLVFTTDTNPFNLSHWLIIAFSGFAIFLSNYILTENSKFAQAILVLSLIDFGLILVILNIPSLFDLFWNTTLAVLIAILGFALLTLIPSTKSALNTLAKISMSISFLFLLIICIGQLEIELIYQFEFYLLVVSSLFLILAVLGKNSEKA